MATGANVRPDRAIHVETGDGPSDEGKDDARLEQIRDRFQVHQTFWSEVHSEGLEDDKFVAGEQWPEEIRKDREEDGRPILTYNLIPSFTRQITNRVRENRSQVKVIPVESNRGMSPQIANLSGTKDFSMADVYSGAIRNIEHVSRAEQAYDTALKHAVDHGFGYFYLMNEWSKLDPFVQDLVIHRVRNSYTIYLDPDAQEADYRDMQDAFMFENIKKSTFTEKYPDAIHTEFAQTGMGASYDGWYDRDMIRLAQYFWIDWRQDEVLLLNNGKIVYNSVVEDVLDELKQKQGIFIEKDSGGNDMRKKVKRPICMWEKMTSAEFLESRELPFSAIPIFPVLGEELIIDGRTRYESAIRHAKDPQRSYNYWRTAAAEVVALATRAPWLVTEAQIAGHEDLWEEANTRNLPYLPYNHKEGVSPPTRVSLSTVAAAELQNATADGVDMQTIIGLHDASLGKEGNEKSGKAIIERKAQGATSTYQFPDNLSRAQEQCGRLMVEAIPKLFDTRRIIRIRLPDDTDDFVEINQAVQDDENPGKIVLVHDIGYGKYDVTMETGPSYSTQRAEAADLQMELLNVLGPDRAANIVHLIVKNLGVPGSDEVATVLRKMLPEQLKSEDEKIADLPKGVTPDPDNEGQYLKDGEPWQPPMTPEMQVAQKQQELDEAGHKATLATAEAKMATAEADKVQAQAKIKEAEAKVIALESEVDGLKSQIQEGKDSGDLMTEIEQTIQRVMEEHEINPNAHKEVTQEMIADAVVEALKRTKAYIDRNPGKVGETINQDASRSSTGGGSPAASAGGGVNINIEPKPDRIDFEYDEDGNIIQATPFYGEEGSD